MGALSFFRSLRPTVVPDASGESKIFDKNGKPISGEGVDFTPEESAEMTRWLGNTNPAVKLARPLPSSKKIEGNGGGGERVG